ncbi:MAG: phage tail tape measure protein [Lachnospiraceae bacterium]
MADGKIVIETGLDTKGIETGLKKVSSIAKTGIATAVTAISGMSTALAGVAGYSIKVGSSFEASMSKVQAVSGASNEQLQRLSDKAKEMGATTKFSATEAADAMNYMAMAGWKTEDMLNGIDGIMNLAAASGEDLATTSDIVTDALTAFGLTAQDSTHFADVLAAASSNANTNVSMMGETFKYVAPVAGSLGYSAEDCAVAIGLMANSGIKASQSGTALRSMFSRLAKPSKEVKEAMEKLNISLTDSHGNMKSLDTLMGDLRNSFSGLSESEKAEMASSLAGQEAMSGLLAIVNASDADFNKLKDAIYGADGASAKMAETMQDNLQGKITITKSTIEGLGIKIYEEIEDPMKEAAEGTTDSVEQISSALENGGIDAAVEKTGNIIGGLSVKIAQESPKMVDASVLLLKSFVQGIKKNKNQLKYASREIIDSLCDGLIKLLPKEMQQPAKKALDSLKKTFSSGLGSLFGVTKKELEIIGKLFTKLADHMDTVAPVVISLVAAFKTFQMVQGPVGTVVSVLMKLQSVSSETGLAVSALNAIMSANPAVLIAGAIAALVGGLALYATTVNQADAEQEAFNAKMDELGSNIESNQRSLDNLKESMENTGSSIEASVAPVEKWKEGLNDAFDSTGKVKEGCEDTANYILNQLNEAMGTSYSLTTEGFIQDNEGVKQSLEEVNQSIDAYIQSLKQKAVQEATTTQYTEAIQNQSEAQKNLTDAQKAYNDALNEYAQVQKDWSNGINDLSGLEKAQKNLDKTREKLGEASQASVEASVEVNSLDQVMGKLAEGTPESVQEALDMYAQIPTYASEAADGVATSQKEIQSALSSTDYTKMIEGFQLAVMQIDQSGGKIPVSLRSSILQALNEVQKMGPEGKEYMENSMQQMMVVMEDKIPEFEEAASTTGEGILDTFQQYLVDSGALEGTGSEAIGQLSSGITSANVSISAGQKAHEATEAVSTGITQGSPTIQESARNALESGINSGVTSADVTSATAAAGKKAVDSEASGITSGMGSIGQALNTVNAYAMSQMSGSGLPQTAGQTGSDTAGKLASGLISGQGNTTRAALNLAKTVANSVKAVNLGSNLQSQARQAVTAFTAGIRGQTSTAGNAARALGTSTAKALSACNLAASGRTEGTSFGNAFAVAIASQNGAAKSSGNGLALNAKNALQAGINGSHNIGLQFSAGFASGIRSGQNGVAAAAAAVANAAANAAKANLDIHSPSRVGDWIGKMFDYGIGGGMTKNTGVVEKAAGHVTDSMRIDTKSLLSMMRGAMSSTISGIVENRMFQKGAQFFHGDGTGGHTEVNQTINIYQPVESPVETSRALRREARRMART